MGIFSKGDKVLVINPSSNYYNHKATVTFVSGNTCFLEVDVGRADGFGLNVTEPEENIKKI